MHRAPHASTLRPTARLVSALFVALASACGPQPRPAVTAATTTAPETPASRSGSGPVSVRLLLVAWAGSSGAPAGLTRTRAQAEARANTVAQMAREPSADVAELARELTDLPLEPSERGTLRLVPRDDASRTAATQRADLVAFVGEVDAEAITREARSLRVGDASDPIVTERGFVIVVRAPDPPSRPTEIAARHLLVMYAGSQRAPARITRTRDEARARAEEALRRARAGEDWVALVREYTDEEGSPEGGDLGNFGHGAMVPAFERAAFALEVGDVSDVVESPFGFHVIQRYR
jgi:hypothetical protein